MKLCTPFKFNNFKAKNLTRSCPIPYSICMIGSGIRTFSTKTKIDRWYENEFEHLISKNCVHFLLSDCATEII